MSDESKKILTMLSEGKISVDEAQRLLAALGQAPDDDAFDGSGAGEPGHFGEAGKSAASVQFVRHAPPRNPQYLIVHVQDGEERVNVKVPLAMLRAGMKLSSLMPSNTWEKMKDKMVDKGIHIDLSKLQAGNVEELVAALGGMTVDVDSGENESVRIYCE